MKPKFKLFDKTYLKLLKKNPVQYERYLAQQKLFNHRDAKAEKLSKRIQYGKSTNKET
jgi:hypothetical protein